MKSWPAKLEDHQIIVSFSTVFSQVYIPGKSKLEFFFFSHPMISDSFFDPRELELPRMFVSKNVI